LFRRSLTPMTDWKTPENRNLRNHVPWSIGYTLSFRSNPTAQVQTLPSALLILGKSHDR
jgi:hypothetical protein